MQPQVIRAIVDDAQIGEHILDFGTVKKAGTANDPVRDAVALHGIFQGVGLGIGAIQNGIVLHAAAPGSRQNLPRHEVRFYALVRRFIHGDEVAIAVVRPQLLALAANVVGDDGVGRIQNGLGGAVVLLQADGAAAGI